MTLAHRPPTGRTGRRPPTRRTAPGLDEDHEYAIEDVWGIGQMYDGYRCRLECWITREPSRRWSVHLSINDQMDSFPIGMASSRTRALEVAARMRRAVLAIKHE